MPRRRPEPPEACSECNESAATLRRELAAVILALLKAPDVAEVERLTKERNALGKTLAHLLKDEATPRHN